MASSKKLKLLASDLLKFIDRVENSVDQEVAQQIGFQVRVRMLELISKGINPIAGYGRFPEYLAATRARVSRKEKAKLRKERRYIAHIIRSFKTRKHGSVRVRQRALTERLSRLNRAEKEGAKRGYPYNTKQFKAGTKFLRPVNLFLTGKFLQSLTFTVAKVGKGAKIEIGYFQPKQAVKEQGHREGANGQPKRPTLPRKGESWAQTIQLDIMRILREAIVKATKAAKKG